MSTATPQAPPAASPAPASTPAPAPELPPVPATTASVGPRKRWTIAEFDDLVRQGLLREGSRTYLWDGEIIEPMSENPPHVHAVANLLRLLILRLPEREWTVNQDAPVELTEGYKPQPDLSVLKGPRDAYDARVPTTSDVGLLVEVSDSSYPKDAGAFLEKYAAVGVEVYWIVNIPERRIEVYTEPARGADRAPIYAKRAVYSLDEPVPLFTSHQGVITPFGAVAVRDVLRNSLGPKTKETGS